MYTGYAACLLLFARGAVAFTFSDLWLLLFTLYFLFVMRLFDDLYNKEEDCAKPERNYTQAKDYRVLRGFLIILILIFVSMTGYYNYRMAIGCIGFMGINYLLYLLLHGKWAWNHLLPLIKYPFVVFLLILVWSEESLSPSWSGVLTSLALFPALVVFESLSDYTFNVKGKIWILLLAFLLLWSAEYSVMGWAGSVLSLLISVLLYSRPLGLFEARGLKKIALRAFWPRLRRGQNALPIFGTRLYVQAVITAILQFVKRRPAVIILLFFLFARLINHYYAL